MKKALITGITGQDGSYLTEFLLGKGYKVYGIKRRSSAFNTERIDHLYQDPHIGNPNVIFYYGDMTDSCSLIRIIQEVLPDEIYNLAAQSHVKVSFDVPEYTADVDALGPLRILEAIRILGLEKKTKFYQASTSELYGNTEAILQNENTLFSPCSPYSISKLFAHQTVVNYRRAYGMFACNGILFNHESPRRGKTFVTKKIVQGAVNIFLGKQKYLYLGNLNAKRDWGYAKDYVKAMWLILQNYKPDDFVIATGEQYSVRQFCEYTFKYLGIEIKWQGTKENEIGIVKKSKDIELIGKTIIKIDINYYRPEDVNNLKGDSSKAYKFLGWRPEVSFEELVGIMVEGEIKEHNGF